MTVSLVAKEVRNEKFDIVNKSLISLEDVVVVWYHMSSKLQTKALIVRKYLKNVRSVVLYKFRNNGE